MPRKKPPPSHLQRFAALLESRLGHVLVRLTIAALVFLLAGIVMRQARAYTYRLDEFRLGNESLEFEGLPDWADGRVRWTLQPRMFPSLSISIYDPRAEGAVRSVVERHPLVREVRNVRVLYPNKARVTPILRVPVARVAVWKAGEGKKQVRRWRLLTDDGCLLPRGPYKTYLARLPYELPVVTGIAEEVPQNPDEVWEDRKERVQEAVSAAQVAARLYRDFRGRISVTRIDVSRFPAPADAREEGEVRLVLSCPPTRRGGERVARTVEWGRTDRARGDVAYEDDYTTKLERLRRALTAPRPPAYIEVRWELTSGTRSGA
ncbi:MAG: hypothetical protein QNJ90_02595 [Planctomycetota bacterium]|nr:hypothetical protein [Planctomycetota bacterium]